MLRVIFILILLPFVAFAARKTRHCAAVSDIALSEANQRFNNLVASLGEHGYLSTEDLAAVLAAPTLSNPMLFASRAGEAWRLPFHRAFEDCMGRSDFDPVAAAEGVRRAHDKREQVGADRAQANDATRNVVSPIPIAYLPSSLAPGYGWVPQVVFERGSPLLVLPPDRPEHRVAVYDLVTDQIRVSDPHPWPITKTIPHVRPDGEIRIFYTQQGLQVLRSDPTGLHSATQAEVPPAMHRLEIVKEPFLFSLGTKRGDAIGGLSDTGFRWYAIGDGAKGHVSEMTLPAKPDRNTGMGSVVHRGRPWLAYLAESASEIVVIDPRSERVHWKFAVPKMKYATPVFLEVAGELRLAVRTETGVRIVDPIGKEKLHLIPVRGAQDIDLVTTGNIALLPQAGSIDVVDLGKRKPGAPVSTGRADTIVPWSFSSGDKTFVAWEKDGRLTIADIATGKVAGDGKIAGIGEAVITYTHEGNVYGIVGQGSGRSPLLIQLVGPLLSR